jgi:hypothetical protein
MALIALSSTNVNLIPLHWICIIVFLLVAIGGLVAVTLVAGMVGWDQSTRLVNDERREGSTGLGSVVVTAV